jgi:TfoX/Sxy family transcriptional regulator of competence genes
VEEAAMKWRKPPEELVEYFNEVMPDGPQPVESRPMFGAPCCWTGGNMFAAVHQESMIVRLSPEDRAALLAEPGAALFEPMEGRPMREYVVIPPRIRDDRDAVGVWLRRALAYTASLPPKAKKPRQRPATG